jgi:cephalosporin hydroxylase
VTNVRRVDQETTLVIQTSEGEERMNIYSIEGFHLLIQLWLKSAWQHKFSYNFTWLGTPIIQLPEDMFMMQELLYEVKPDVVVETGTAHGGTAIFYASILELLGNGHVISVDVELREHNRLAIEAHAMHKRITLIEGSSTDEMILARVQKMLRPDYKVLVALDSNHTYSHVRQELEKYSPMVTPGSYIVVFDGVMEILADAPSGKLEWATDSPVGAIRDFLSRHMEFEVDPYYNRVGVTYCQGGFLRRKEK